MTLTSLVLVALLGPWVVWVCFVDTGIVRAHRAAGDSLLVGVTAVPSPETALRGSHN